MAEEPLWQRMYQRPLFIELTRTIGHLGFATRDLSERLKPLVQQHGVKSVSAALAELVSHEGNHVHLKEYPRKVAHQLLGPVPTEWPTYYKNITHRPKNWDNPPEIPKGGPDPIMEEQYRKSPMDLMERWKRLKKSISTVGSTSRERDELACIESEFIRRGMELPELELGATEEPSPKRKRKKVG